MEANYFIMRLIWFQKWIWKHLLKFRRRVAFSYYLSPKDEKEKDDFKSETLKKYKKHVFPQLQVPLNHV